MATAIVARVISSGRTRGRRLGVSRGVGSGDQTAAGASAADSRFALVSTSDMANSARSDENHRRENNHVNGEYKQRGVPDMAQQAEAGHEPPQPNCRHPRG